MRPTETGAGGEVALAGAAGKAERTEIVAERDAGGKQAALARLGEILAAMPKNIGAAAGGKKDAPRGSIVEPRDTTPTLADLGIDKKVSE